MKKITLFVLCFVLVLTGCSNQKIPDDVLNSDSDKTEIADPMDGSVSQDYSNVSTAYGVTFGEENIEYAQENLIIHPTLTGGEGRSAAGFLVFVDGIPYPYTTEQSENASYIADFEIPAETETVHDLTIQDAKVDASMNEHYMTAISLLAPAFVPDSEAPRFGIYHRALHIPTKNLSDGIASALGNTTYNILKAESSPMTNEQKEKFGLDINEGGALDFLLLQTDDRLENTYSLANGENSIALTLDAYCTLPITVTYRITFFVNHAPVSFNGGYDCLDIEIEGGKISEEAITISGVKEGDFIYCVAVPLSAGESAYKSDSKMIVSHEAAESQTTKTENTPQPETAITLSYEDRFDVLTASADALYAVRYWGKPMLCKINASGEIEKQIEGSFGELHIHDGKIFTKEISSGDSNVITIGSSQTMLRVFDSELNEIKSAASPMADDFTVIIQDFDEDMILFTRIDGESQELCTCDWNGNNQKVLMCLPDSNAENASAFTNAFLCGNVVAFGAQGKIGNENADYYGVCDFSGHFEIHRKDGIQQPLQVYGNTALWSDYHVDLINGESPSGSCILYQNGRFQTITFENVNESQDVFLTSESEFYTAPADREGTIIQYVNGEKKSEYSFGSSNSIEGIYCTDNRIFVVITLDDAQQIICMERTK